LSDLQQHSHNSNPDEHSNHVVEAKKYHELLRKSASLLAEVW
jgi:hypothetical protein